MKQSTDIAPNNSLVLIMDRSVGVVPKTLGGGLVAATSSCVAVGTREEHEGEILISISDEGVPSGSVSTQVFDGMIETPSRALSVCSVLDDVFLEIRVAALETHVQVWANDLTEPDVLEVVVLP